MGGTQSVLYRPVLTKAQLEQHLANKKHKQDIVIEIRTTQKRVVAPVPVIKPASKPVKIVAQTEQAQLVAVKYTPDEFIGPRRPMVVSISRIQQVVCVYYGRPLEDMQSLDRKVKPVKVRQVAVYLARVLLNRTYAEIGRWFGKRDHTTILHGACKTAWLLGDRSFPLPYCQKEYREPDPVFLEEITVIKRLILTA